MKTLQTQIDTPSAPTELSTEEARQGVTGHNVRYVLGFGLTGVIIAFLAVGILAIEGFLTR